VVSPLLSRSLVLRLESLTDDDVRDLLRRAAADERGLAGAFTVAPDAEAALVRLAAGDARRALTALEAAADGVAGTGGDTIDLPAVERAVTEASVRYDRQGDQHYDVISAFIKSSAAPTRTRPCTTSPACSWRGRTRASSRGG
jgi:putative ATPase